MVRVACVDISEFQQNINFNKMKNDSIKAVILRAGYDREVSQKNHMFESHYRNAKNAGLKLEFISIEVFKGEKNEFNYFS